MNLFKIRKVPDGLLPSNKQAVEQVFQIMRDQFPDIAEEKILKLTDQWHDPVKYKFSSSLFIAEDGRSVVKGFAFLFHLADINSCFLDYLAVKPGKVSSGIGGALYERLREEAQMLKSTGIFMECLPDDPHLCKDPGTIDQNRARLAFYEKYGARPIAGTKYETIINSGDDCPPYLVFDDLGHNIKLAKGQLRKIVRAILERKYPDYCPPSYVRMVIQSIQDDPVKLREFRYTQPEKAPSGASDISRYKKMPLIVNDRHDIHHIREKGYIESPIRIRSILKELEKLEAFKLTPARGFPDRYITDVHNPKYVTYFKNVCNAFPEGKSIYPYVFPIRNATRPPQDFSVLAGYYCIDTFTPLNKNAYLAARAGVNCALTGAQLILEGYDSAYALVRPPGHHAERDVFGGFCYFNNASIAANYLSKYGKVALLDIDYHHGNGHQSIFYHRKDVLTISIHGHPSFAYPYFTGFSDETGEGEGVGMNINFPLKESIGGTEYLEALKKAIRKILAFNPVYLIISLGLDIAKGDPTGTWSLRASDFKANGALLGRIPLPTLFIQEGGYKNHSLGINARHFFQGFLQARKNSIK